MVNRRIRVAPLRISYGHTKTGSYREGVPLHVTWTASQSAHGSLSTGVSPDSRIDDCHNDLSPVGQCFCLSTTGVGWWSQW